ncbi:response regulator [Elusimicrobiota bacterium]
MREKILIVDDDPDIREQLVLGLAGEFEMHEARDAGSARRIFRREIPGLVFLDIGLPRSSGLDLIPVFTGSGSPATVIMLTSHDDLDMAQEALELGATEYLTKPCDISLVRRIARKRLGRQAKEEDQSCFPWRVIK